VGEREVCVSRVRLSLNPCTILGMGKLGYARVSTKDQDLALQIDALTGDGVAREDIYTDQASGSLATRPGLDEAIGRLEAGDVLVVWKLDRLGRSLQHLVATVKELGDRGIGFRSLTESIDTTNGAGKFMFHVFAALAEFERDIIIERTNAGLAAARAHGRAGGRPPALTARQTAEARRMVDDGVAVAEVARILRVSRASVYRAFSRAEVK
jgi:DNA invertase Pin-like site-specific DNA recombinase